jgi:hypothetical protein
MAERKQSQCRQCWGPSLSRINSASGQQRATERTKTTGPFHFAQPVVILTCPCGIRHFPHNKVSIIETLWALSGSLTEGRIVAR